ncbi:putative 6-phosphogluconolactonase chloroplastic-like [Trifolium pratense]|uniref:Putative 6-phosphogluconolactonase chloroplastic-like n=1 Tax=Trifolium pratense TaxID=57577 RepID=A0A2K3MY33_TRIPR|nr:putative 6-phosphogluconolactonase chloroplastic-like [Trifolium pratense]
MAYYTYTHSALHLRIPSSLSLSNPNIHLPSTRISFQPLRFKGLNAKPNNRFICKAVKSSMAASSQVEIFEKEELAVSLAKYTADLSNKFTHQRGAFTVCLSGGSLINYLRKLLEPPHVDSIEWAKWHVFWVDERVVPKDHQDSNYKLAFDGFLSKVC